MTLKTVAHSVIRWIDDDGVRRQSFTGEVVDFPESVVEKYEPLGAFVPDGSVAVSALVVDEDAETLQRVIADRLGLDMDADGEAILDALDELLAKVSVVEEEPAVPPTVSEPVVPAPVSETQPVATTVEPAPAPKSDPAKPKPTDLVKVWEDYAVEKGFDRKEAEKMSKSDLIAALS